MSDWIKSIGAVIGTAISWVLSLNAQDTITFLLASILTIVMIIFVIWGIRNRILENKIKRQQLNELQNGD